MVSQVQTTTQQKQEHQLAAWQQINNQKQQYVSFQKMVQWSAIVFKKLDRMEFLDTNTGIEGFLEQYLKQQCQITDSLGDVQFKYEQGVQFINWMIRINQPQLPQQNEQQNQHSQNSQKDKHYQQQQQQNWNGGDQKLSKSKALQNNSQILNNNKSKVVKNKSKVSQRKQGSDNDEDQKNANDQKSEFNQQNLQNNSVLSNGYPTSIKNKSQMKKSEVRANKQQLRKQSEDVRQSQVKQTFTNEFQQTNKRPVSQFERRANLKQNQQKEQKDELKQSQAINLKPYYNWQQYLRVIFEHYCKLTYAMGQDPTFELIQHKSQTMTVNKFMIFCRDFLLLKMPNMNRNLLVDLFKKHSECFKEMNLKQFIEVLEKIGRTAFPQQQNQQTIENDQEKLKEHIKQPSKNLLIVLKYLQIDSNSNFRDKMKSVGILNYKIRGKKDVNVNKKQPINYKFKFQPSQKSTEQINNQIADRKNVRSQKKLTTKARPENSSSHNMLKKHQQTPEFKSKKAFSQKNNDKKLPPAVPPKKPYIVKPVDQRFNNQVTGYANIHRLKRQGKFDASRNINSGFVREGNSRNRLKLNSIVQQARMQVQHSNYRGDEGGHQKYRNQVQSQGDLRMYNANSRPMVRMRDSQGNYRQVFETDRSDVSTPYESSQQQYNNKNLYNNSVNQYNQIKQSYKPLPLNNRQQQQQDLLGLIDDQDDEDEFLKEHLHRERKVDHISKRINQKILEMDSSLPNSSHRL